jgi:UDP-glucose 4-epimerase
MNILVTGGAGYIGSHMVNWLLLHNYKVSIVDNLSNGHLDTIPSGAAFYEADVGDALEMAKIFAKENFDAVFHFAGLIQVGESVVNPILYYDNNVVKTINLLKVMVDFNVLRFIFSSTAAIYGLPMTDFIDEDHAKRPINPYGRSKLMIEDALHDFDAAYGLKSVSLRYFNAAGAHPDGVLGERHNPETHLIPLALESAMGLRKNFKIFGSDYQTSDGTCIRDFVHVWDLCQAHALALDWILKNKKSNSFNLGSGQGYSILEILGSIHIITGHQVPLAYLDRRQGDPSRLVALSTKARRELNWIPAFSTINKIIEDAYNFLKLKSVKNYDGM